MQQIADFFDSPTFYIILWIICGVCFFVFRKNYKEDNSEILEKAEKVNQDKIGQFFLKKVRNQGNSSLLSMPNKKEEKEPKD